jgi:acyl-CoA reductase-like NAD-dependent aldehyde dehydrogenase
MDQSLDIADTKRSFDVRNPKDNALIGHVSIATDEDIKQVLANAEEGCRAARLLPRHERSRILLDAASMVRARRAEFAKRITAESGKTYSQALKETDRCVNTLTLSAEEAKRIAGDEIPFDSYPGLEDRFGYFTKEPLGIVLAITPFNDPLNLVAHKIGPAIAAGCACILKPAIETPYSAIALVEMLHEAGFPPACLQIVIGDGAVGDMLVRDDRISMVSFTGGAKTGELICRAAGLKRTTMDLGGNAPVFVLPDANIERAATECASGAFWAAGQNCIGVQRIYCHKNVLNAFRSRLVEITQTIKTGDPDNPKTDMGPMVSEDAARRIEAWVNDAIASGASCLTGNQRRGAFYDPTILENVPNEAQVLCEEVFAPVVCLVPYTDLDEAITEANTPDFLLHGAVFTNDLTAVQTICDRLECSGIMINDSSDFRFDGMPFGGSKRGSLGREGVKFAVDEMTQSKVICFKK